MCGICGSLSLAPSAADADADAVRAMMRRLVHRGPDSGGLLEAPGIAAGIRRLAVIDPAGGDQPQSGEDGSVSVVFNGEIYNHAELRGPLEARGHRFRTRSDTEVLVHLWEEHGPAMVESLNGMFAFCVHDARRRETFIARDRLGIKPLYYVLAADRLLFASEVAALLEHPACPTEIDPAALVESFAVQYVVGERTVYAGVRKLLPGHAIHVRPAGVRVWRYHDPIVRLDGADDEPAPPGRLRDLLESSVNYRRIADVPLGVFLSGGLDSAVIVATLAGIGHAPVRTFSVGFEGSASHDERAFARAVAGRFETEHHELLVSPVDIARELPRLVEHLAEPVTDPAMIPTYLLSRFARERVTVALTGEGADELFGGYRRYLYQQRYGWLGRVPGVGLASRSALAHALPGRWEQGLEAVGQTDPARNHVRWSFTTSLALVRELFDPDLFREAERRVLAAFEPHFQPGPSRLADRLRADQQEWLPHNLLSKVDRATMATSLEARVPYLDHRIVEWAATLPDAWKIRGATTKYVLRQAFGERLPRAILTRPKQGFDLPLAAWIRGPLKEMAQDLLDSTRVSRWDGLDASRARELLELHLRGRGGLGLALFNLISIMLFLQRRGRTR